MRCPSGFEGIFLSPQIQARICLFNPHVILDRGHPLDGARNLDRSADVGLGADEAAQLDDTLEGFNVDLT